MERLIILLLIVVIIGLKSTVTEAAGRNNTIEIEGPLELEATYIGDVYGNFTGGLNAGAGFLGMANLRIGFDTEKADWWRGGSIFINGASTHGKSPTENFTGDFQVVSNIDAGDLIYLHELWYKQTLNCFEFTIGLQDMNAQFVSSENGGYYLNSSFGIPPVISGNVPVPIFPLTGMGVSASWKINDTFCLLGAIFDGVPTDFDENPHNIKWQFNKNEGFLSIAEFQYTSLNGEKEGTYKFGSYYHAGVNEAFNRNYGFYAVADQTIWKRNDERKLDIFAQLAFSPRRLNNHNLYLGGGVNFHGMFENGHKNTLGIAVANANFHYGFHKHETIIETFFNYQLNYCISLQPDFQFIINPAGSDVTLQNAFIGFLRVGIQF